MTQILAISPTRAVGCLEMIRHRLMINPSAECVAMEYDYQFGRDFYSAIYLLRDARAGQCKVIKNLLSLLRGPKQEWRLSLVTPTKRAGSGGEAHKRAYSSYNEKMLNTAATIMNGKVDAQLLSAMWPFAEIGVGRADSDHHQCHQAIDCTHQTTPNQRGRWPSL